MREHEVVICDYLKKAIVLLIGWLIVQVLFYFLKGTRMWRRGADPDGYVANFVETEQIMQFNGYIASFVQVLLSMTGNQLLL